jgi:hypothetical protein
MQCQCLQVGIQDSPSDDIVIDLCGSSSDEDAGPGEAHSILRQQLGCAAPVKQHCTPAPCRQGGGVAYHKQHGSAASQRASDQVHVERPSSCAGDQQTQLRDRKQQADIPPAAAGAAAPSLAAAPIPRKVNHLAAVTAKMSAALRGDVSRHVRQAAVGPRSGARQEQAAADGASVPAMPHRLHQQGV